MTPEITMEGDRARRILSPRMPRTMGRFMSGKSRRVIHWESQLERDFCYLLEFDPMVHEYREQPVTVPLQVCDKPRRYTPDFLVLKRDGRFIFEVKPHAKALQAKWQNLFDAASVYFADRGYRYQVVTETDIRRAPLLQNIRLLLYYREEPFDESIISSAVIWLNSCGPIPISEFADRFGQDRGINLAYMLIARHLALAAVHNEELTTGSLISPLVPECR